MALDRARIAFGPEALSRFNQIIEEVSLNLVDDGLAAELVKSDEMRSKLAKKLLRFARFWWTDTQIKQLLLRTLRNQISADRQKQTAAGWGPGAENVAQDADDCGDAVPCLGLDGSAGFEVIWRKSVRAPGHPGRFGGSKFDHH